MSYHRWATGHSGWIGRARALTVGHCEFDFWWTESNDLILDTDYFLARRSALLGLGKNWLAQCKDIVTEWDNRPWWWQPVLIASNTINQAWVCTITSWSPSSYDHICCHDINLKKTKNITVGMLEIVLSQLEAFSLRLSAVRWRATPVPWNADNPLRNLYFCIILLFLNKY